MLSRYRSVALAALLIAARDDRADAFTTRPAGVARTSPITADTDGRRRRHVAPAASTSLGLSGLNPDWDNGDFLSSLGGTDEDMDEANDAYRALSEKRQEADEWKLRMLEQRQRAEAKTREAQRAGMTAGAGPSPEVLAKMGQQPQAPPQQQMPPQQIPQQQQMQTPPPPQQKFFDANGNEVSVPMVRDANGNLVPWQPPQMQQQPPPPQMQAPVIVEPPLPPKTKQSDAVPRPAGFNPDAHTMANTADVYFAQLKQDSKVRKIARLSGDIETANTVFADDSVRQIKDSWRDNPYTKEKNIAEARAGIEQHQRMQARGDTGPKASATRVSTGVSYKEKLEQMKAKKRLGGAGPAEEIPRVSNEPPQSAVQTPPEPKAIEQPRAAVEQPTVQQPAPAPAPLVESPPPPKPVVTSFRGTSGTGIGESVIVPPSLLAEQSKRAGGTRPDPPAPVAAAVQSPAAPAQSTAEDDDLRRKVRTLQGLLLKHRGGPGFGSGRLREPEARRLESTLDEVKGVLRSELGISDADVIVPEEPAAAAAAPVQPVMPPVQPVVAPPAAPSGGGAVDPLAGSVACVEAVMKMYKEATSASEREALMIPLREALMAAASQSNKVIAEADLSAHRAAMEAGPPPVETVEAMPPSTMMGFPSSYQVTRPDEEEYRSAAVTAERDDNEVKLREVRDALVNARGDDGRLGLRADLSSEEAADLADKIRGMKGILLDEVMSQ